MKRCPDCNSLFNDTDQFCELDGTPLVNAEVASEPPVSRAKEISDSAAERNLLPLIAIIGVLIGALLFLVYFALIRERPRAEMGQSSSNSSVAEPQLPVRTSQAIPVESVSPSVEPSPSPTIEPTPLTQPTIQLSSNPISTAPGAGGGPVLIKLESGVTIEADEAWQTGEGIWYRRHGLVSLLDPKDIKSIEKVPPASPQPSATAQAPSP